MWKSWRVTLLMAGLLFGPGAGALAGQDAKPPVSPALRTTYGRLPLAFEPNVGQADPAARFIARTPGGLVFLTRGNVVLATETGATRPGEGILPGPAAAPKVHVVRIALAGSSPDAAMTGSDLLPGRSAYLLGNDPSRWHTDVPSYAKVRWREAYPGIDVLFYGRDRRLEFDFVLKPGADPARIALVPAGAGSLTLSPEGDLTIGAGSGVLLLKRPQCYQVLDGRRVPVKGQFRLERGRVGLRLGPYDRSRPLVVDPVLVYSTYLGGSGDDTAYAVTVNAAGEAYVAGETLSTDFPLFSPGQSSNLGGNDAFVSHFNASGNALLYSTYIGGGGTDNASGLAVDAAGAMYVTGWTGSVNFPTTAGVFQPVLIGGYDAFVAKIDPSGHTLDYGTYIGGTLNDEATAIALDGAGDAVITGVTYSANWPTHLPLQAALSGPNDAFVAKLNPAGTALIYSTYLGGSASDTAMSLALDGSGAAYVTGFTSSSDFPTVGAFQPATGGSSDAFVTKIAPSGTSLVYSTFLGGSGVDGGFHVAVDGAGAAFIAGVTTSTNFPLASPFQATSAGGGGDAFVAKLSPSGAGLIYSTYLGGSGTDFAQSVALDSLGSATIVGYTTSTNFPTLAPIQVALSGTYDAFITRINPAGSGLVYSTYLGGTGDDTAYAVALDSAGATYVAGTTSSTNFPTLSAFQGVNSGGYDAFLAKIGSVVTCSAAASPLSGNAPLAVTFTGSAAGGPPPYTYTWDFGDSSTGAGATATHTYNAGGSFSAKLTVTDSASGTSTDNHLVITVAPPATLAVNASAAPLSGNAPLTVAFSAAAAGGIPPYTFAWTFGDSGTGTGQSPNHTYNAAGTYPVSVTATDSASVSATDSHLSISVAPPLPVTLSIAGSPSSGQIPLAVSFTAAPAGGIPPYTVAWDFGDSTTGTGLTTTHTYTAGGTFTVQATVTDSNSVTASASTTVQAINPPAITSIKKMGSPFRLKIMGSNFHSDCTVKINGAAVPQTRYKNPGLVLAKKGSALKAMVPKGTTVQVTVTNNDDGGVSSPFSFTW
ncbi:MAG: PKD domain-containing protein [Acidobacteriota bacterium]